MTTLVRLHSLFVTLCHSLRVCLCGCLGGRQVTLHAMSQRLQSYLMAAGALVRLCLHPSHHTHNTHNTYTQHTALEAEAHVEGTHFRAATKEDERGTITISRTVVGEGCTVLPQAIVSAGTTLAPNTILTPGTTSARPPTEPSDPEAHDAVRTEPGLAPPSVWVPALLLLLFIQSFMWFLVVPSVAMWYTLNDVSYGGQFISTRGVPHNENWRDLLADALRCWLRMPTKYHTCQVGCSRWRRQWWRWRCCTARAVAPIFRLPV